MRLRGPVYIAGPMTGKPNLNYPLFDGIALTLRLLGHEVRNPADNGRDGVERTWEEYMALGILMLMGCRTIVLLPGWQESRGARLEALLAKAWGMEVYEWREVRYRLEAVNSSPVETTDFAAAVGTEEETSTTDGDAASVTDIGTARAISSPSAERVTHGRTRTRRKRNARD